TLQPQSADAVLLVGDIPHRHEPHSQRLSGVLKDCPGRQRRLPLAPSAVQQPPRRHPRLARPPAMRAYEPTRPAQAPDIFAAGGVAAEPLVNLLKRPGIINPGDKISGVLHPPRLSPGPTGVKRITYRYDYAYERNGTANLFMTFARLEGWRHVEVTDRHTAVDYAQVLKDLSDKHYPNVSKIVLVQDNLNTH